jgi:predicted site-specific integrase-resolvase
LVQDLLSIVQLLSARLYGMRSYRKVIRDAALQKDQAPGE